MQNTTTFFSFRTFALSIAAAELGRAILGAGENGSVRAKILLSVPAALVLLFFSVLALVNRARMNSPRFSARCLWGGFAFWYLVEAVRTAAAIQQICWEQFSSMTFVGLLPLLLWAGWSLTNETFNQMAKFLWWLAALGVVFCVLGLAGQFRWQNLTTVVPGTKSAFPDVLLYPEYFSFPLFDERKDKSYPCCKSWIFLPAISIVISSGYALGEALLFGVPKADEGMGYPGYELLRAWNFGGISRFDAAFLLLWLAAALFRLCFLIRAVHLLVERLVLRPGAAGRETAS